MCIRDREYTETACRREGGYELRDGRIAQLRFRICGLRLRAGAVCRAWQYYRRLFLLFRLSLIHISPHLLSEKEGGALKAMSGMPMIQFSLVSMLQLVDEGDS